MIPYRFIAAQNIYRISVKTGSWNLIHFQARQIEDVQEFREKIKRKQAAAIVIQSAWRGHKVRVNLEDADLSNRDICHWYQVKVREKI